jgi:hypothetical protein
MNNDTYRTYVASILEVFRYLRIDHGLIHDLAHAEDSLRKWKNPDDGDHHQSPHTGILATENYLRAIRDEHTLCALAEMYKMWKMSTKAPPAVVFRIIIIKMLWIASGRGEILQAA